MPLENLLTNSPLPRDVHIHVFSGFVLHDEKLECDTVKEDVIMKIRVGFLDDLQQQYFEQTTDFTVRSLGQNLVRYMKILLNPNLLRINEAYTLKLMKYFAYRDDMICCGISPNKKKEAEKEVDVGGR